jgi:hypothetical protein
MPRRFPSATPLQTLLSLRFSLFPTATPPPCAAVGFSVNPLESSRCSGGSPDLVGISDGATTSHRWPRLVSWRRTRSRTVRLITKRQRLANSPRKCRECAAARRAESVAPVAQRNRAPAKRREFDDAGALTDQSLAHLVERLQVELFGSLGGHEPHRWPLHGLGDCLRITEVVLLPLRIGPNIFSRHQPGVVAKAIVLATKMMRANAGFHSD